MSDNEKSDKVPLLRKDSNANKSTRGRHVRSIVTGWGMKEVVEEDNTAKDRKSMHIIERCLSTHTLFEDDEFPANENSLGAIPTGPAGIEWKRPKDIVSDPTKAAVYVDGTSRFDVSQGELGNCWMMAALSSLATCEQGLHHVLTPEQNFGSETYTGLFRMKIWRDGHWTVVIVDDRLPTRDGKLVFVHSSDENEFWAALIEKAFAKLHGSYASLGGGLFGELCTDLTGGLMERFDFNKGLDKNMDKIMTKAIQKKSFLGCSIDPQVGESCEAEVLIDGKPSGIIRGHAYSITDAKTVDIGKGPITLVRVRNPWGTGYEWNGAWSDKSPEWKQLQESTESEAQIKNVAKADGESWMSYDDFTTYFQRVEICHWTPTTDVNVEKQRAWNMSVYKGKWTEHINAGGCRKYKDTYWQNPQYIVDVKDPDEDDDDKLCTIIISLLQFGTRELRQMKQKFPGIGFDLYKISDAVESITREMAEITKPTMAAKYARSREVNSRFRVEPGRYVIVPTTYKPDRDAKFLLRVYTETQCQVNEVDRISKAIEQKRETMFVTENMQQEAEEKFKLASAGNNGTVDAHSLFQLLNTQFHTYKSLGRFNLSDSRSLLTLMDYNRNGELEKQEFIELWALVKRWRQVFEKYDWDKTDYFNSAELRLALASLGYQISNATLSSLIVRFADRDGYIYFDDFVTCAVKIKSMFDIFADFKKDGDKACFTIEEFIQLTTYT